MNGLARSARRAGLTCLLTLAIAGGARGQVQEVSPVFLEGRTGSQPTGGDTIETFSIQAAVASGLRRNRALQVEELELERAQDQVNEAYGNLMPDVDATVTYQRNLVIPESFLPAQIFDPSAPPGELIPVQFGADNQWFAGLSVNQPLFDASIFVGVGTAGRFRRLQDEAVRGRAQEVTTAIRRAYYLVLATRELLRLTENSLRRIEQTLEETRALQRAGLASAYDVLRLEVQVANIEPNIRREQNAIAQAERGLSIQMGLDGNRKVGARGALYLIDLSGENDADNQALIDFTGVPDGVNAPFETLHALAMANRSDLRQARLARDVEQARVSYEKTRLLPTLSAFFNYNILSQQNDPVNFFGDGRHEQTSTSAIGLVVEIPLFDGFKKVYRAEQAKVEVRKAETRLADLEERAKDQISTAQANLIEARARAEAQRGAVSQARRGFEIVSAEYLAGTASRLDVSDGELALSQAELNYSQAVFDYLVTQAELDLVVGVVPMVDPEPATVTDARDGTSGGEGD